MKQGIHPEAYRFVVFKDMSNGESFLSRSTAASKETVQWEDGNEYPLIKLEISSTSHPFFTGKNIAHQDSSSNQLIKVLIKAAHQSSSSKRLIKAKRLNKATQIIKASLQKIKKTYHLQKELYTPWLHTPVEDA